MEGCNHLAGGSNANVFFKFKFHILVHLKYHLSPTPFILIVDGPGHGM